MAHLLKQETNLFLQDSVDNCNLTNRSSKRKISQISDQHIVNKKSKICEENATDLVHCNELQEKTCKIDNVDLLAENIPILVDNSNVLENNCTNSLKNNKQEKLTLKAQSNVLQNFHQCKLCPRSFRSAQTLAVHCNFQHKNRSVTNEASVSSDVNNTIPSIQKSTIFSDISEKPVKQVIAIENVKNHTKMPASNFHCVAFNDGQSCNNDVNVNCKGMKHVVVNNSKTQNKSWYEKKEALPYTKCVQKDGNVISYQQKNALSSKTMNLSSKIFCTVIQNHYFCSTCGLMMLNKKDASVHTTTNHSEVRNKTKINAMAKRVFKCKRNGKQCIVHKSLYFKQSLLSKNCEKKTQVIVQRFYCCLCKLHFAKQNLCVTHINQVHGAHNLEVAKNIKSELTTLYKCYKCHGLFKSRAKLKYHLLLCNGSKVQQKLAKKSPSIISNEKTKNQEMKTEIVKQQFSYLTETSVVEMEQASEPSSTVIGSTQVTSELQDPLQIDIVLPGLQGSPDDNRLVPEENLSTSSIQLYQNIANPGMQTEQCGFQQQSINLGVRSPICNSTTMSSNSVSFTSTTSLRISNSENLSENCSNDNAEQYVRSLANTVDLNIFEIILDTTYFCPTCNLAHKRRIEVLEHMYVHHPQSIDSTALISVAKTIIFNCKLCQLKQYSVTDCSQHVETCHRTQTCSNPFSEVFVDRFHCTNCELHFAMRHHCIRHMYTCHSIKVSELYSILSKMTTMYKCHNCLKIYQTVSGLNNHTCQIIATERDSPYSSVEVLHHFCPLCDQHFPGIKSCQRHLSLTHPDEPSLEDEIMKIVSKMCVIWICHICSSLRTKHFDSKHALAEHMMTHGITVNLTDEEISEVVDTGKQNTRKAVSQRKASVKTKQKPNLKKGKKKQKKKLSDYETTDDSQDSEHIFGLNPDEDSQNSKSSLNFAGSDDIVEHSTNNFVIRTQVEYPCPFCNLVFVAEYATLQHIQQGHSEILFNKIVISPKSQQTFTCKTCETIVYSIEECNQHDSVCAFSYAQNEAIEVEIKRIHCPSCPQHFAMRHHCIRHMCKVHAVKAKMRIELLSKLTTMHKCPKCMKLYHSIASLNSHISRCTIAFHKHKSTYSKVEDELYFCPLCSQYFTSMYLCRRHMNLVHINTRVSSKKIVSKVCTVWICHLCSSLRKKYFDSKASLNEHMLKHKIRLNENIEETSVRCEGIKSVSDENTSNDAFAIQDHKITYLAEDCSKLISDKSEKYEPPAYINDLSANTFNTEANSIDVTQSQYIENVSMDFYSTNLANVIVNDFTQNLPLHQTSTFDQTQAPVANSGQDKETNTESLLYGFQILNSMSTTTDSELQYDKQINQSHMISAIDSGLGKCLTPIQNISPVCGLEPMPHSNMQYSQPYLNSFDHVANAQYPSLDYSTAEDVKPYAPLVSNDHNFYLYPEYVNTSSCPSDSYSRDDLTMLHNIKPDIPQLEAANYQNIYPGTNYLNMPQYSNVPQYTETNIPIQEQNYQEFNTNSPDTQYMEDCLLQESECSVQVTRSHCPQCNLHFSKQHDCVYHVRNTHTTDLQVLNNIVAIPTTMYKCHNCNKLCVTMSALKGHILKCRSIKNKDSYSCSNENRYFCPFCQQHFQNLFLCERHINLIHKDMPTFNHSIESKPHDLWICHICSTLRTKYFDTKALLADHMMIKHYIPIDDMHQNENSSSYKLEETAEMPSFCGTENSMQSMGENSILLMQESSHCEDYQNITSQQCSIKEKFISNDDAVLQTVQPLFPCSDSTLFQIASNNPIYHPVKNAQDPLQTSTIPEYATETFSVHSENTQFSYANSESHDTESNTEFSVKQEDNSTQMSLRSEDNDSSVTPSSDNKLGEQISEALWTVEVLRTHCNICMLHFSNPQNCMNHIKVMHKFEVNLGDHIHTKLTTMYKCDKCAKICVAKAAVKHHIATCKSEKNRKEDPYSKVKGIRYFCPECQQHFSSVAMCRRHININHENAQILFEKVTKKTIDLWVCQICSTLKTKYFDTKLLLAEHMTRHNVVIDTNTEDVTLQNTSLNPTLETQDSNTYPTNNKNQIQDLPQNELQEFQATKTEVIFQSTSAGFANTNCQPTNVGNDSQTFPSETLNVNYHNQEPVYAKSETEVNIADAKYVHPENQVTTPTSEHINTNRYVSAEHLENNNPVLSDFISCLKSGYSCLLCDKNYDTELHVFEHLKMEHQIDSFEYSTHVCKTDTESYVCKACELSVNSIKQCVEHKSVCQSNKDLGENEFAVNVKRFYCPVCFAHHSQKHHTYRHLMNVHDNEHDAVNNILHLPTIMYKCNNCCKLHVSMALLRKHISICNKSQTDGRYSKVTKNLYYCPTCEQHFSCQNYCKKHIKQCHNDNDNMTPVHKLRRVWICNVCSSLRTRLFDTKSSLAEHMLSHDVVVEALESDSDDDFSQQDSTQLNHELASHSNDTSNCSVKEIKTNKDKSLKIDSEVSRRMTRSSTNSTCS